MREIKFRGYVEVLEKMFTYEMLKNSSDGMVKVLDEYLKKNVKNSSGMEKGLFLPTEDEELTLMQWTGLCDYKGIEIYEGDIVKVEFLKKYDCENFMGIVEFKNGSWVVTNNLHYEEFLYNSEIERLEVISNIFEVKNEI